MVRDPSKNLASVAPAAPAVGRPVSGVQPAQPALRAREPSSTPSARVLVVDDHPHCRRALARQLEATGCSVVEAGDGEGALRTLGEQSFDVVVTDLSMPGLSGLALLERALAADPSLSVILISGDSDVATVARALELGASRYFVKPFDTEKFGHAVRVCGRATRDARAKDAERRFSSAPPADKPEQRALSSQLRLRLASSDAERHLCLQRAFDTLWLAHQPIVYATTHRLLGYELLMRFDSPGLAGPPAALQLAAALGRAQELSRRVRELAAVSLTTFEPELAFVNLRPEDLLDPSLRDPNAPLARHAERVVLEITERGRLESVKNISEIVGELRQLGYRLAVDDLGAGYSGLNSVTLLEPEFVKIDMSLVRGIDSSSAKRRVVAGLIALANELGTTVVSEGVETEAERATLLELGTHWLQGYLIARPGQGAIRPTERKTRA